MKIVIATYALLIGYSVFATLMFVNKTDELVEVLDSGRADMAQCRALHAAASHDFERCIRIIEPSIRQQIKMEQALSKCWSEQ